MVLLILESLGSTELLFILVMALVFFGPRKLPQLSRTMGKHLAEFRRASEDFKRTWDREVTLEETGSPNSPAVAPVENSILNEGNLDQPLQQPRVEAVAPDRVIPRQAIESSESAFHSSENHDSSLELNPLTEPSEPSQKRDWL